MPKAPRDPNATPKKRTRKATPKPENSIQVEDGNGIHVDGGNGSLVHSVTVAPQDRSAAHTPNVEEQVRFRAYQLYLERGGHGGSPEQDWFRALQEISQSGSAA
jgi:hypothetical protein